MLEQDAALSFLEQIRGISDRTVKKFKSRLETKKTENDIEKKLLEQAKEVQALMKDMRYGSFQEFLAEVKNRLNLNLEFVLTQDFKNYTREARADKAAILSAQIWILKTLIEYPEKVLERVSDK